MASHTEAGHTEAGWFIAHHNAPIVSYLEPPSFIGLSSTCCRLRRELSQGHGHARRYWLSLYGARLSRAPRANVNAADGHDATVATTAATAEAAATDAQSWFRAIIVRYNRSLRHHVFMADLAERRQRDAGAGAGASSAALPCPMGRAAVVREVLRPAYGLFFAPLRDHDASLTEWLAEGRGDGPDPVLCVCGGEHQAEDHMGTGHFQLVECAIRTVFDRAAAAAAAEEEEEEEKGDPSASGRVAETIARDLSCEFLQRCYQSFDVDDRRADGGIESAAGELRDAIRGHDLASYGLVEQGTAEWQRARELELCREILGIIYTTEPQQNRRLDKAVAFRAR